MSTFMPKSFMRSTPAGLFRNVRLGWKCIIIKLESLQVCRKWFIWLDTKWQSQMAFIIDFIFQFSINQSITALVSHRGYTAILYTTKFNMLG